MPSRVDGTLYRMRVTKRQDDGNLLTLDLVADDAQALVSAEITDSDYTPQTSVSPLAWTAWADAALQAALSALKEADRKSVV